MSAEAADPVAERVHKWLGGVPSGWTGARLFEVAEAWTSNVDKHAVEGQPCVRLCNYVDVYKNDSIVDSLDFMTATATREQIKKFRIRVGDTLITKDSETADDIGIPAFVEYEADDLVCGYHLAIVRPDRRKAVPRYLYWVLSSEPIARQWGVTAAGVTRVGIRSTDLNKVTIPLPPLDEQRVIADYLDRETAQIDALVAKQEEFVRLLRERRRAAIESAVSSVETSGERLKHVTRSVRQGWSPQCYTWPADGVEQWAVLKAGAVNGGVFRPSENKELPSSENPRPKTVVRGGDLVISRANTRELVGSAAVVDGDFPRLMLSDKLYAFDLDRNRAVPRFVAAVLSSRRWRDLIEIEATGASSSMLNISQDDIVNLPMSLPGVEEQESILQELDDQTGRIDALISKAEEHIAFATERRSALITAAATGQIDVCTARKAS